MASCSKDMRLLCRQRLGCIGGDGSVIRNLESISEVLEFGGASNFGNPHPADVTRAPEPDWYLQEWMAHFEKKQAALVNELGWEKSKANDVWHGKRPYRRSNVNEISSWLGIEPYELLMPPQEALQLRGFRAAAIAIAAGMGGAGGVAAP